MKWQESHNLISVARRVIFWGDDQTATLGCTSIDSFDNVDQLLLVVHCPIYLIVVTSAKIDHNMFVPIKEHHCTWVIQLIHLVEVRNVSDINQIDDREVLHFVRNGVECLVHLHALWIPVMTETDDDDAILLGLDRLIDVPA